MRHRRHHRRGLVRRSRRLICRQPLSLKGAQLMFDTDNRLLTMLAEKQIPLGMQCFTSDRALIEVLGLTGFDFVMLDTEHSATNPRAIEGAAMAADTVGLVPLVRVPHCGDETATRRAMEAGAQGIFVPEVRSAEDVRRVLAGALFPPLGKRGIFPGTRAARYSYRSFVDYAEWNNRNFVVGAAHREPRRGRQHRRDLRAG